MSESDTSSHLKISQAMYDLAMTDETLAQDSAAEHPALDEPGSVLAGRYLLRSLLGEGSTGFVWRAEQTKPVRREVAVKVIRQGLVTEPVSARFNREHQVLARMEHPNIAAVFDAGELADGRTFFAMELVDGMPITSWCARHETPLRARLEIFLQACQAVQHAHQKGVLHRDLKPSNVLVTMVSGSPLVKVIDFGIAKALSPDLAPGLDMTLRGMVLGTPRYMSPEQAGLTGQDVDTRTDVFALGVLLYELLTGTTPIPDDEEKTSSLSDLLQRVRHAEVERPSRRVTRAPGVALTPHLMPRRLARELSRDLDWIVLRALQNDRELRYPTVSALAGDVQSHLRDEPVSAGPPGMSYRLKKWGVRHRGLLTGLAAVLCVSLAGVAATWWALDQGEAQRMEAERQKQRAFEEADLAKKISTQLGELLVNARKHVQAGMNTAILRQIADECAEGMPRFAGNPKTEASLARQLAHLYANLEEPAPAMRWYQRTWELLRETEGPGSRAALEALYELGWRAVDLSLSKQAVEWLREAADGFEKLPDEAAALAARKEQARALSRDGRHEEAVRLYAGLMERTDVRNPKYAIWLREQGDVLRAAGRVDEALAVMQKAVENLPPGEAGARAYVLSGLAALHAMQAHWDAALEASLEHLKALENQVGPSHQKLLNALIQHALMTCKFPGCPGGEETAKRALALARSTGHETRLADAWTALSEVLRITRRFGESEQAVRDAIEEVSRTKAQRWRVLELRRRLGDLLVERGAYEEALEEYETAFAGWFEKGALGRPPENERMILSSLAIFWQRALKAGSPIADEQKLAEWRARLAEWDAAHPAPRPVVAN